MLADMRHLGVVAFVPIVLGDPGDAASDACWRAYEDAEERRWRSGD